MVYDIDSDCLVEVFHKEDPQPWIDEQISEGRWGEIDEVRFEITDYDLEKEPQGILISDDSPDDPIDKQLWLQKTTGILYSWSAGSVKWLSVDRAAFIPVENLRSEPNG